MHNAPKPYMYIKDRKKNKHACPNTTSSGLGLASTFDAMPSKIN